MPVSNHFFRAEFIAATLFLVIGCQLVEDVTGKSYEAEKVYDIPKGVDEYQIFGDEEDQAKTQDDISHKEVLAICDGTIWKSRRRLDPMGASPKTVDGKMSGNCYFEPHLAPSGAVFDYTNYVEYYIGLDEGFDSHKNGTMTGTVEFSGLYNGTIEYFLDIEDGEAVGGHYTVTLDGRADSPQDISYKFLN